jgi:hypothetical protein
MGDMDDVVSEFLVESYENLDRLDSDLLALESNSQARAIPLARLQIRIRRSRQERASHPARCRSHFDPSSRTHR